MMNLPLLTFRFALPAVRKPRNIKYRGCFSPFMKEVISVQRVTKVVCVREMETYFD
jgi:hypothetical protein